MDTGFLSAVGRLQVGLADQEEDVDVLLDKIQPMKRKRVAPQVTKRSLEEQYLKPSTSFGTAWLNKFQQCVQYLPHNG